MKRLERTFDCQNMISIFRPVKVYHQLAQSAFNTSIRIEILFKQIVSLHAIGFQRGQAHIEVCILLEPGGIHLSLVTERNSVTSHFLMCPLTRFDSGTCGGFSNTSFFCLSRSESKTARCNNAGESQPDGNIELDSAQVEAGIKS